MNERIRELQSKSYLMCKQIVDDDGHVVVTPDQWFDKFAELLVLEMCNVLDKAQWDKGEDWVCADGTRIIPQVKEHFGVE